ncbi:50S ribosomal protein L37ae [Candidatus Woesearchaeota archaeon]|nr:50S ribosomal protein L37ae [Candidatus Woesearchaeota archaeon]
MAEEKVMTVKRFGARYGRKIRYKVAKIEEELKKKHKCPYCSSLRAKRAASGIWECRKCGAKFTGKAYSIAKRITFEEEIPEEVKEGKIVEKTEDAEDRSSKKKKEEKRW